MREKEKVNLPNRTQSRMKKDGAEDLPHKKGERPTWDWLIAKHKIELSFSKKKKEGEEEEEKNGFTFPYIFYYIHTYIHTYIRGWDMFSGVPQRRELCLPTWLIPSSLIWLLQSDGCTALNSMFEELLGDPSLLIYLTAKQKLSNSKLKKFVWEYKNPNLKPRYL